MFDGNHASDGGAMNLAYYSAKFDNVTFRNSTESAVRVSLYVRTLYTYSTVFVYVYNLCNKLIF